MARRRRTIAVTAVAAILAALVVTELLVRLTQPPPVYIGLLPFEPELGYRMPPSYQGGGHDARGPFRYQLNSLGFRGPELPAEDEPKTAGRTRILFVGDSFMTPTVREEEILQAACVRELQERGIAAEAFTLCCNDYGTAQELLLLERHGPRVRPDVVVLAVYPANDVGGNSLELAGQVETCAGDYLRPYLVPSGDGFKWTFAQPVRAFLRAHLRSFALLDKTCIVHAGEGGMLGWYAPWPLKPPSRNERVRSGLIPAEWLEAFRAHGPDHPWERAWRITEELVRACAARTRALGARFLVLVIPSCNQVEINALTYSYDGTNRRAASGEELAYDLDLPERRLAAFGREAGFDVRPLLEPLRESARVSGRTSYLDDGHLNARGCAVGGAVTADWIAGSEERPAARTDPAEPGAPVRILPPDEDAPRTLVLRDEREPLLLGAGWFPYLEPESGRLAWASGPDSVALLPIRGGDRLFVSGWLPPESALPVTLTVQAGGSRTQSTLEAHGPFRVQLDVRDNKLAGKLVPVQLHISPVFQPAGDWRRFGAFVTRFELRARRYGASAPPPR